MNKVKGSKYWRSAAILFADNVANLVKLSAPHCVDDEALSMLTEIAMSTKSILLKDGEFEMAQTQTTNEVLNEAVNNLQAASQEALMRSLAKPKCA